ncbi:MAG: ABC transporter permease [Bacteroidales bacterium]|nr:ABC transporter permease [Bacteroidales bacterium]
MSNLFDIDNWREIGATLARNKTRTFLTAFGIFWGTAMLALLWGTGSGMQRMMMSNFEGFATNSCIFFPNRTTMPYKGYRKGTGWGLNTDDVINLRRRVPDLEIISPIINTEATFKHKDKTFSGTIQGLEPNYLQANNPVITSGRFITDYDVANMSRVCVIGENIATSLFPNIDPLGQTVEVNNVSYRVVGTVKQKSDMSFGGRMEDSMVIPISTFRTAYNMGNHINFVFLVARDGVSPTNLKDQIFTTVRLNHPIIHPDDDDAFQFFDISEIFGQISSVFTAFDFLVLFVGLSSLIAGVIGVGNIMWIVVKERTQEFGVRRAIGAKPRTLLVQILSESAVLTVIAGIAGICFAVGVLGILGPSISAQVPAGEGLNFFQISFNEAVWILILFLVLGGAAGIIPALKAMKIKPIEALNDR